jgi:hypothetical protein
MGSAKQQEIRLMGLVLLVAVVVGTFATVFFAVQASEATRAPTPNASVSQSGGGPSLAGVLGQG